MKTPLLSVVLFLAPFTFAAEKFEMPTKCTMLANQQAMDYMSGFDGDGVTFFFKNDGSTQIAHQDRIISHETVGDTETIIYNTKIPIYKIVGNNQVPTLENVRRKVTIKRNGGKIVSILKDGDLAAQVQSRQSLPKGSLYAKAPFVKGVEGTFTYGDDGCALNQQIIYQMENEKAKVENKVTYDKKFCDSLNPIVKQMGSQNANLCVNLLAQAQSSYDARVAELSKEQKTFVTPMGDKPERSHFSLGMMVVACSTADMPLYGGMGLGYPIFDTIGGYKGPMDPVPTGAPGFR